MKLLKTEEIALESSASNQADQIEQQSSWNS